MTKKEMFAEIKAMAMGGKYDATADEISAFCDKEIDALNRKKSTKSKKTLENQEANKGFKALIAEFLTTHAKATCSDIRRGIPELEKAGEVQKTSYLVRDMMSEGLVTCEVSKGKSYYSLVEG